MTGTKIPKTLEVVSKCQIRLDSKALIRYRSGAYTQYVSILNRITTQLSGLRWGFETTSDKAYRKMDQQQKDRFVAD
jgi:hypothetical protein